MKPGRLQNALKFFGRAPECFKTLWADSKIHGILGNVGSGAPKNCKIHENPKKCDFFRHQIVPNSITGMERSILNSLWKKRNDSVLKFPRPVGIFESDLFWKRGSNLLSANSQKIVQIQKNTWKSRKLKKSIKTKGNKQK